MSVLSAEQIGGYAKRAGVGDAHGLTMAIAVALAESGGVTTAIGDVKLETAEWGPSLGLWQIRSRKPENGKGTTRDGSRLFDPAFNAHSMAVLSGGGKNWQPWSTVTHPKPGADYREHLDTAAKAAARVLTGAVIPPAGDPQGPPATAPGVEQTGFVPNPLDGLKPVGKFFDALVQINTWIRLGYVLAGVVLFAYGTNLLSHGAVGNYVHTAVTTTAETAAKAAAVAAV